MNHDLKLIENTSIDQNQGLVIRHARLLADYIDRASHATSKRFIQQMQAAISEAEAVTSSVDLTALADDFVAAARPASTQEIKRQLQILIGAFPNTSRQDLSLFGVALLEDVVDARPTIGALTNACRHLRRSNRFVPSISEVLEALAAETGRQSALLADVRDFPDRLDHARIAVAEAQMRVEQGFERIVRFCQSRIQSEKSLEGFDAEVIAEARRRLGPEVDSKTAEANRKRLAPLLTPRAMPKKDTGWADAEAISNDMRCSTEIMEQ